MFTFQPVNMALTVVFLLKDHNLDPEYSQPAWGRGGWPLCFSSNTNRWYITRQPPDACSHDKARNATLADDCRKALERASCGMSLGRVSELCLFISLFMCLLACIDGQNSTQSPKCLLFYIIFLCALVFCLHTCLWEGRGSLELEFTESCELPCGCQKLNPDPPEEQSMS